MAIYNLGSINIDHFYRVPHMPAPGETLSAAGYQMGLGGKGANQSAAAAKAGARVVHIGAVGPEGLWTIERLQSWGVVTGHIVKGDVPTGHAIINVDTSGENTIVLYKGANYALTIDQLEDALQDAGSGDMLVMQNETSLQAEAAQIACSKGMTVVYSAAPFDVDAVRAVLPYVTILALNTVEAEQLCAALGTKIEELAVPEVLVTRGAEGAEWRPRGGKRIFVPAIKVEVADTTGAGDTFAGYFAAARDGGMTAEQALELASAAAALKVTRRGTADSIPSLAEVKAFRG